MKLTYLLGAGASANALPIVKNMDERIGIFVDHLKKIGLRSSDEEQQLSNIYKEIKKHYTIDTYAKKLFLKGRHAETELFKLYNFMGVYFIYEQLKKEEEETTCSYLFDRSRNIPGGNSDFKLYQSIIESVDYRYDSFYAALLKSDVDGNVYLPDDINIISWNYDFQLEISFMNFINSYNVDDVQNKLNVYPTPKTSDIRLGSSVVKINGTAGFFEDGKSYGNLFDFRKHILDSESIDVFRSILFQKRASTKNSIYFAWIDDEITKKARSHAKQIIASTDILVVVGYSFPYFNRNVDRDIFSLMGNTKNVKIYIQTTNDSFESIRNRASGVKRSFEYAQAFTEVDQFLIPNELE